MLDATGHVASGQRTSFLDGEPTLELELARVEGNLYRYAGELQRVPSKGEFRTLDPQGLSGVPLTARNLATHLARSSGRGVAAEIVVRSRQKLLRMAARIRP